jgi:hypothetical protein
MKTIKVVSKFSFCFILISFFHTKIQAQDEYICYSIYEMLNDSTVKKNLNRYFYIRNSDYFDKELIVQSWVANNNNWINDYKYNKVYDDSNNLLEEFQYKWDTISNSWRNNLHYFVEFDALGKKTGTKTLKWDISTNTWNVNSKTIYTLDNQDYVIEAVSFYWNNQNNDWDNFRKEFFTYDENYRTIEYWFQDWKSSINDWESVSKILYTYATDNVDIERIIQAWNVGGNNWVNHSRRSFVDEERTQTLYQNWQTGGFSWLNDELLTYIYDENEKLIETNSQKWHFGTQTWRNSYKNLYNYAPNGDILAIDMYMQWNQTLGAYGLQWKQAFDCGNATNVSDFQNMQQTVIYPNPTLSSIINVRHSANANYHLTDLSGKLIYSGRIFTGENVLNLDMIRNNGLYFLTIDGKSYKIIMNK